MSQSITIAPVKRASLSSRNSTKRVRTTTRRDNKRAMITRIPRGQGLPKMLSATLRYYNQDTVTTNGSGVGTAVFIANGCYQPKAGTATHQPHYFDQYMALYDHYRVVSSKCTFTVMNKPTGIMSLAAFLDDDTTPSNIQYYDAMEREGAVFRDQAAFDTNTPSVSLTYDAKRIFGPKALTDSQYGSVSTNPTENQTFCIHITGPVNSDYYIATFIQYFVEFTEQRSVVSS